MLLHLLSNSPGAAAVLGTERSLGLQGAEFGESEFPGFAVLWEPLRCFPSR